MTRNSTDEKRLWSALLDGEKPRQAGIRLGINAKRVVSLCIKWTDQGKYNYGVAADLGWIENEMKGK